MYEYVYLLMYDTLNSAVNSRSPAAVPSCRAIPLLSDGGGGIPPPNHTGMRTGTYSIYIALYRQYTGFLSCRPLHGVLQLLMWWRASDHLGRLKKPPGCFSNLSSPNLELRHRLHPTDGDTAIARGWKVKLLWLQH
jgi:hypothetical protein